MPVTICAAMRVVSPVDSLPTAKDIIEKIVDASVIRILVRSPAGFSYISPSKPIIAPAIVDYTTRAQ